MRAFFFICILLSSFGHGTEDSGGEVMGVKIKRYGREASEGRGSIEDHSQRSGSVNPSYRPKAPMAPSSFPEHSLPHPLGEGLVYPKRKPITFW